MRVLAAALNPLDISIAAGLVPTARHEKPYVPGIEAVGEVVESDVFEPGQIVYGECHPSPTRPGCFATHVVLEDQALLRLPEKLDPVAAVAVGNSGVAAFLPLIGVAALQPNEAVLILGATGTVGRLAVQVAREHDAGYIVAVGRNEEALARVRELGADAAIPLRSGEAQGELVRRLQRAGPAADVILDGLGGDPLNAAMHACAPLARIVNIGNSAGEQVNFAATLLRSRQLTIKGFASFLTPLAVKRPALEWMWSGLLDGNIHVDTRARPLEELPVAWTERPSVAQPKTVIVP
ncbi:zinc-binding dehydrogenase [Angustibacter luteus]